MLNTDRILHDIRPWKKGLPSGPLAGAGRQAWVPGGNWSEPLVFSAGDHRAALERPYAQNNDDDLAQA
jgi:hypothetical protein